MTRSTSPQSIPRSRVEVQTTAFQTPFRHRGLDAAALADIERAVMQGDRQFVFVDPPEFSEGEFSKRTRIDEDETHMRGFDEAVNLGDRVACRMAGPGQVFGRIEDRNIRRGARAAW